MKHDRSAQFISHHLKANLLVHSFAIHGTTFLHRVQVTFLIKYFEIDYATKGLFIWPRLPETALLPRQRYRASILELRDRDKVDPT